MKPFEKWETEEVERTFGIIQTKAMPLMDEWLQFQQDLTPRQIEVSEELREMLQSFANFWNEEDIKVFFIMPLIQLVNFYAPNKYRTFMEATFEATLTDAQNKPCNLRGRVEMVVATGKQDPQIPFFFLRLFS